MGTTPPSTGLRPAVFLDRDDTLILNREVTAGTACPGDLFDPALVRLVPGAGEALRRLRGAGFALVVVTNQGAVARGSCTVERVEATHERMQELVEAAAGARLDAVYFCPHHPKGTISPYNVEHEWRKPLPGMFIAAAREHGLDLARSWMIGDAARDIEAAVAAGIARERTIMVGGDEGNAGWRVSGLGEAAEVVACHCPAALSRAVRP